MSALDANAFLDEAAAFEEAFHARDSPIPAYEPDDLTERPSDRFPLFVYDRYDWSQFDPEGYGYNILRSKKGYFAPVSLDQYDKLIRHNWWANVQRDRISGNIVKIYFMRYATKTELRSGAPQYIYLHRYLTETILSGRKTVVDHRNADSLDNRDCNLRVTSQFGNMNNAEARQRTVDSHSHLPRGVEPVTRIGSDGIKRLKYLGGISVRGKKIRSKTTFTTPKRARRWYLRMHAVLHPEACSVNSATAPPSPIVFPPLVKSLADDVPF